jgi:hypothetical protein
VNDVRDRDDLADDEDRRIAALLAAPQAEANPAVWARVRTRLAAEATPRRVRRFDGLLDWLTRPAALAAATAALVGSLGAGWSLIGTIAGTGATTAASESIASSDAASLVESLLESTPANESLEPADDGAAPRDSGGRS